MTFNGRSQGGTVNNNNQLRNELVQERRDIQSKHIYFLMAAAGASLGFSVQKLEGQVPGPLLYIGLTAMALWILSFAFGCVAMMATQAIVSANMDLLHYVQQGMMQAATEADQRAAALLSRVTRNQLYQFFALSLGVVLFATWRVLLIFYPH